MIKRFRANIFLLPVLILLPMIMAEISGLRAQTPNTANYEESKVGSYTLPDPLITTKGVPVRTPADWKSRREELLELFASQVYGRTMAPRGAAFSIVDRSRATAALNGLATRQEMTVQLMGRSGGPRLRLLLYLPRKGAGPHPVFLGMNFNGNQSVTNEPEVALPAGWMRNTNDDRVVNNRATEKSRGGEASRWPLAKILQSGYGVATIYYGDLFPDYPGGLVDSVIPFFYRSGQTSPRDGEWGAIGAWAWGMSRALDVLQTIPGVDGTSVILHGHSRIGKAALWAGAQDKRFAIVISNESGEGGAALARRYFGETVERINTAFPHWFCGNFKQYSQKVSSLPVDQHELIALIAPRPVYVASAAGDQWADPRGEFLSAKAADPVYRLLGTDGLGAVEMPELHQPVTTTIGYHIRAGKHDVTDYDWDQFINFANIHLKKRR
jgi:hypothetical protein